ncbi:DUF4232 domain-containing protein [Sphingomonas sp. UYP23]
MLVMLMLARSPLPLPHGRVYQLHISLNGRGGDFSGMSHSGTELSIRNTGADCFLVALPTVQLRDARNRVVPAVRQAPRGMHPGPVMTPVRLTAGHRAAAEIRWVSGPVFTHSQSVRASRITVRIGTGTLTAPLAATLYREVGQPATFEQTPMRAIEGMVAG